jgi:two-component system LytT family sensor kinase
MKTLSFPRLLDQKRLPAHLLIFGVSVIIPLIMFINKSGSDFIERFSNFSILLFIQVELFILIARIVFRKLPVVSTRKEITVTVLSRFAIFLAACFIIALVVNIIFIYVMRPHYGLGFTDTLGDFFDKEFSMWLKATSGGFLFGTAIFIFIQWQDALRREQRLREENLIFQNETLKNQVNPHFLFNSLNTLSSLIATQPEIAENFTIRLASIYRYILENSSKDKVPLTLELSFISDYFYLHKIRDDGKIGLDVKIDNPEKYEILPVSLQILVENAIKHNKATLEEPLIISIYLEARDIVVRNNLQKMATKIKSTEIGLKNLSERVKLISARDLIIEETSTEFIVKIPLLS